MHWGGIFQPFSSPEPKSQSSAVQPTELLFASSAVEAARKSIESTRGECGELRKDRTGVPKALNERAIELEMGSKL